MELNYTYVCTSKNLAKPMKQSNTREKYVRSGDRTVILQGQSR